MSANMRATIWLQLRGIQQTVAGLSAAARQTGLLGTASKRLATEMTGVSRRSFLMNQAIFTLRRYSYMATLAVTAGTVAIIHWGYQYKNQVQQARLAFSLFLPGPKAVNDEIRTLYRIAAVTPFLFTDITTAARRFLAFGMTAKDTNRTVVNITDALSALGLTSGAALNRASLALGHMMSLGRLTGQVVYQLARDNVPIIQALEQELGLTGEQLRHVGTLGISAGQAINALNTYIEKSRYHGAGERFGLSTLSGILSTLKDYTAQFVGNLMTRQFVTLQRIAKSALMFLQGAGAVGYKQGGVMGFLAAINPNFGRAWQLLASTFHSLARILTDAVIPAFSTVAKIILPILYVELRVLTGVLSFASHHTLLLRIAFIYLGIIMGVLAARMILLTSLAIINNFISLITISRQRLLVALGLRRAIVVNIETGAEVRQNIVETESILVKTRLSLMIGGLIGRITLVTWATRLWTVATVGSIRSSTGQFVAMSRLEKLVLRMRIGFLRLAAATRAFMVATLALGRSFLLFLFTNPVGWAILLIGALVILYWKWEGFRRVVNTLARDMVRFAPVVAAALVLAFGPIGAAIGGLLLIIKYWRQIKGLMPSALTGGTRPATAQETADAPHRSGWGNFWRQLINVGHHGIPGMAGGGSVTSAGWSLVGENGPELRYMPSGASVVPLSQGQMHGISAAPLDININTKLVVDGRELANVVAKHRLDRQARK